MAFMLEASYHQGWNLLLLSSNKDFCASPERAEKQAARWQRRSCTSALHDNSAWGAGCLPSVNGKQGFRIGRDRNTASFKCAF